MGIYFRSCYTFMPEQFLHAAQPGVVVEHCRRKGMAQHVGRPLACRSDEGEVFPHYAIDLRGSDPRSFVSDEEGIIDSRHACVPCLHVVSYLRSEFVSERHYALLASLARELDLFVDEAYVTVVESHRLCPSRSRGIKQEKDGAGADVGKAAVIPFKPVEEGIRLRLLEENGQRLLLLGPTDEVGRVFSDESVGQGVPVHGLDCAELPADGGGFPPLLHQRTQPFAYHIRVNRLELLTIERGYETTEIVESQAVRRYCDWRCNLFRLHVPEKIIDNHVANLRK